MESSTAPKICNAKFSIVSMFFVLSLCDYYETEYTTVLLTLTVSGETYTHTHTLTLTLANDDFDSSTIGIESGHSYYP